MRSTHQEENTIKGPAQEEDDTFLPPRNTIHPTEKEQWLPIFYRTLLWLFIMLVVGLIVWGWRYINRMA